jgi:hypothetical protein
MSIIGISTSPGAHDADLGVPPARPMDRHSDFVFSIIQIYDDFLYQYPGQPLLGSHGSAGRIPSRRKIVCECQQAFRIDSWARTCLLVHPSESLLQFSNALKRDVPSRLKLTSNQAFGRIHGFVSARCQ